VPGVTKKTAKTPENRPAPVETDKLKQTKSGRRDQAGPILMGGALAQ
jgi:hypothetical protein